MSGFIYKNNVSSLVVGTLLVGATTLNVTEGEGANFPSTFPFRLTIWDRNIYWNPGDDSGMEIVHVTGRTTDALTIVRAQEGTADVEHVAGEKVAMLWTAGHFNDTTYGIVTKLNTIETNAKDDQTASEVPIVDGDSIITATNVEDALAENRIAIDLNTAKNTNATHTGDVTGSGELTIGVDKVKDTHIDWGTGAGQVSSYDIPDHGEHTVRDTFVHIVNRGVSSAITITLTGGLNFSWTTGEIYDIANHTFVVTEAGSGSVTDNAVNYLKWVSGTTLTISTSDATGNEVLVAIGSVYDGNINGYREMSLLDESLANIRRCARAVFPTSIVSGMSVHEDTDVTNPLDVTMDAGVFCKEIQEKITPIEIKSRNTAMVRHFHTAGALDSDTNAQIETANYDNGTNLIAIPSGKYVKALFIYMNGKIGFIYPREYFNTIAQAQNAALPAMPTGLEPVPKLTAIVYQEGDTDFISTIWQDVRSGISEQSFSGVTDHGALAGLSDDDHTQYALLIGRSAGQTLIGGTTTAADLTFQTTSGIGTTGADMHFLVGNAGATEAMTILNNGNVGIGTNAPAQKFHIAGEGGITWLTVQSAGNLSIDVPGFIWKRSRGTLASPTAIQSGDKIGYIALEGYGSAWEGARRVMQISASETWDSTHGGFGWGFYSRASGSVGAPSHVMELSNNGNVGIGTTDPDTKLDVNGAITQRELSSDPLDPDEGSNVTWQSDGTGSGNDGDIMMKITAGGVTKTVTLIDFSIL